MNNEEFLSKDGLSMVAQIINSNLKDKVDKVEGKGLSTNDFTDEYKQKVENAGDSSFSGNYNDLVNKPAINGNPLTSTTQSSTLGIKASDLTNDEGFQTEDEVKALINTKISSVMTYKGTVENYTDLPPNATVGDTYNITNASEYNKAGDNVAWNGTGWDVLAGTIDLSNYWSKTELVPITNEEIVALFEG